MIGEHLVEELRTVITKLKYQGATWEWSIWEKDRPRLHFLRITLAATPEREPPTRLFSASGLSLFRSRTPLSKLSEFLDYCLDTRREYEKVNQIPFGEQGFRIGQDAIEFFGNFPSEKLDFYGSLRTKTLWFVKGEKPFFIADYALHDSVRPQVPRNLSLHGANPPFANPREAYKHFFGIDIGERSDPWVAIIAPVYLAYVGSFKMVRRTLIVELKTPTPIPKRLFLSVVARGQGAADFRERVPITRRRGNFRIGFTPTSLDLALYLDNLRIDFVEWSPRRRGAVMQELFPVAIEDAPPISATPLFDRPLLAKQPDDIRFCLEHAEKCCLHQLWIPASLMLRKALEIVVNLKLKQLGRENDLYTQEHYERPLPARLQLLANHFPRVRRDLEDLRTIKWFGDKGAHSNMALYESDIRSIVAPRLRAFLTTLELRRSKTDT